VCSGQLVLNPGQFINLGTNPVWVCGPNNYDDNCVNGEFECIHLEGPVTFKVVNAAGQHIADFVIARDFVMMANGCGTGEGNCD